MNFCKACNGMEQIIVLCEGCNSIMRDFGRVMDYYDNYSAYMEINELKLEDGYPTTFSEQKCPHLLKCPDCRREQVYLNREKLF